MDFTSQLQKLQRTAASTDRPPDPRSPRHSHCSGSRNKRPRYDNKNEPYKRRRHHYPSENAMRRALATIPHYRPEQPPVPSTTRHIALLVLTIDDLPHEEIWKAWATTQEKDVLVSVVCHAKFPNSVKSKWLRQRLLVEPPKIGRGREYAPPVFHTRRPEWGSIEITRAMLDLLHEGLEIGKSPPEQDSRFSTNRYLVNDYDPPLPPVDKFIFVSESCLPVTTLGQAVTTLFGKDGKLIHHSWVNARNTPNNGYSRQQQFEKVDLVVPKNCIWKADQWKMLSRAHASAILQIDRYLPRGAFLWQCLQDVNASDELYFPTALSLKGILPASPELQQRRITYADWSVSARNPASFHRGMEDLQKVAPVARKEGCLFARKFVPAGEGRITVEEWQDCINSLTDQPSK